MRGLVNVMRDARVTYNIDRIISTKDQEMKNNTKLSFALEKKSEKNFF